ncbi:hypothetical protein GTZ97_09025 [Aquabacterium fontiphilum]|uniref:hypothetical protein n=1 Tax=Aquabacterium fontiphilum TaxID=450365 RepID=UPI00137878FB|nr:hypothetical protein [Aquabacterium fontiphilum]NBD20809.1 hypothetical protein [Aquabacterium fontiphilum]
MKLRIVSLAAVAALAGQAHALTLAEIDAARSAGTLLEVTMSGATALSGTIGGLFTQNCKPGTLNIYLNNKNLFAGESVDGNMVKAYACELVGSNNDFGAAYNNRKVLFQKSDEGGSGNGVFPVATNSLMPFLNVSAANCNQTTKVCNTLAQRRPDGGVSDVSPVGFNPSANRPLSPIDFSANADVSNSDFQQVRGVLQIGFGLAVSQPLYAALQAEQGTSGRPSVPKTVISNMLSNAYNPELGWTPLLSDARIGDRTQINICRRVNGSGTQTSANRFWLEYGANEVAAFTPATNADNSEFPNAIANVAKNDGLIMVYEGSSTGNVRTCLTEANTKGAFAIGHISLENPETAAWKFVRIDGVEPSRDNMKRGIYEYLFESTIQVAKVGNSAAGRAFMVNFTNAAQKSTNLNSLSAANQAGVLTLPDAADCPATFTFVAAGTAGETAQNKFCGRVTRPNVSNVLTIIK